MLQTKIGVTTARNAAGSTAVEEAKAAAASLGALYVERTRHMKLENMMADNALDALIVLEKDGPRVHAPGLSAKGFAYHPSMAVLRVMRLAGGDSDSLQQALLAACGKCSGLRLLDATLGLGADATVASFLGAQVMGLEASQVVQYIVSRGLAEYATGLPALDAAMRRIQTQHVEAQEYLAQCAPDSFDVVYFDAMFQRPVQGSAAMDSLRPFSYAKPLSRATVELALQAAPCVVIKERNEYVLRAYGCREFVGGRYSRVKYGILRRGDELPLYHAHEEEHE